MGDAVRVHVVDCFQKLLKVEAADRLVKGTSVCDVVEELASIDLLLHDIGYILGFPPRQLELSIFVPGKATHHVFVHKVLSGLDLLH